MPVPPMSSCTGHFSPHQPPAAVVPWAAAMLAPEAAPCTAPADMALAQWLWPWLEGWQRSQPPVVAVALSGGADSTAVLLACVRAVVQAARMSGGARHQHQGQRARAVALPHLVALHVHHGLQAQADHFVAVAQRLCAQLSAVLQQAVQHHTPQVASAPALHFHLRHVHVPCHAGDSVEAAARHARYLALAEMAQQTRAGVVLLGHHADDQAESLLLALSRGAGVAGLAGMAQQFTRHGVAFARPFLGVPAPELRAWLRALGVPWVEDPTNTDQRHTRNRLRHTLLPAWQAITPAWRTSLGRSARLAAEADTLLGELAAQDLEQMGAQPRISALQALSRARQANVLRHWLKTAHGTIGSEAQLHALLELIHACRTRGHRIHLRIGAGFAARQGDVLVWQAAQ